MSSNKTISDIVDFNPKRPIKKGETKPFIEMAALPVDNRDVSELGEREFKGGGSKFKNGDTLFARITPCLENGKTAKVNCLNQDEHGHGSTEFIVMSAKEPEYDEDYVYYLARHPEFRAYAQSRMEGTSGRQRVAWQSLAEFEFDYPDKDIRKEAGKFLKEIDDKVALNTQTNQTLEQIAQALFRSWFVDFDPVKAKIAVLEAGGTAEEAELAAMSMIAAKSSEQLAELKQSKPDAYEQLARTAALFPSAMQESELGAIPEGWEVLPLGSVIKFQNGYAFKSKELTTDKASATHKVFKMGNIKKGGGFNKFGSKDYFDANDNSKIERYLIKKGDLLMCMTDMKNNVALLGHTALMPISDQFLVNQRVGLIRKSDVHYLCYPYLYFQTNENRFITDMRSRANSGVQVNLSTQGIKETLLIVPPKPLHDTFDTQVRSFLELIFKGDEETDSLSMIRDALLPQLLFGDLLEG